MSAHSLASKSNGDPGDRVASRLTGLVVVCFALLLWFVVIPWQVDPASSGWMRPRTLPGICAVGLSLSGAICLLWPTGKTSLHAAQLGRIAFLLALVSVAVWLMARFGFVAAMTTLALALVLFIGERRWVWAAATIVIVPGFLYLSVVELLGRSLP